MVRLFRALIPNYYEVHHHSELYEYLEYENTKN